MHRLIFGTFFCFFVLLHTPVFAQLPIVDGWTVFTPSADSRIIYVSSSDGNDATAEFYNSSDSELNGNAFLPGTGILPYQTLTAAKAQLRDGFPDWILLQKGDVFNDQSFGTLSIDGRSANEPILIGSYGTAPDRPEVLTGANSFLSFSGAASHIAIVGIYAEPHTRTGSDEPSGINILNAPFESFLVEDCHFHLFHMHLVVQDYSGASSYTHKGFTARRNILTDAYKIGGGGGGVYMHHIDSILFEENLIDHNGWNEAISGADATGFSHNTYFQSSCAHLVFRKNIVSRASAVGIGARCGGVISDNLLLSNPRNLFVGSFDQGQINWPTDAVSGEVTNNVILDARAEAFDAGNGITIDRIRNVEVRRNIVAHFTPSGTYNIGIGADHIDSLIVTQNIVYDWGNNLNSGFDFSSGVSIGPNRLDINRIASNDIQLNNPQGYCVNTNGSFSELEFQNNRYFNVNSASNWFSEGSYANWVAASSETGSSNTAIAYSDPNRSISTYLATLSLSGDLTDFIDARKQMTKGNWNSDFTADVVNDYIREGFDMEDDDLSLEHLASNDLHVYPNPSNDGSFHIATATSGNYRIYALNGRLLQTGYLEAGENTITDLEAGIYVFKLGEKSVKVVVL